MTKRKIFIIGNPFAGKKKIRNVLTDLSSYLNSQEVSFEIFDTQEEKNAIATVSKQLDKSHTDLIIVGGDGTINEAVNGLKYDIPTSIIPTGTGNDFAKNVSLGKSRKQQFEIAVYGKVMRIDLGKCNDRIFANGIGIGFDGQIVEDTLAKTIPFLKGHMAYYYHVLRILGSYKERQFSYQIDGKKYGKDLILLTVGNGTTFGGGFKLMPDAKVDDGLFEICEIGKLSPLRRFLNIHRLSNGTHGKLNMVNFCQGKEIQIEENPLLFAHADGELMGQPPYNIKILPGALQLRVANS